MSNEKEMKQFECLYDEIVKRVDFKRGQLEKYYERWRMYNPDALWESEEVQKQHDEEKPKRGVIKMKWKGNVCLELRTWFYGSLNYYVTRNGEQVSCTFYTKKYDEAFFRSLQHLVNEIENGDYDFKKTYSEKIADIVNERQLTSYMNETKWKEFLYAMVKEMPEELPYTYKTLFEEEEEKLYYGTAYDCESFNYYQFKSLEWVKVKPKYYEFIHRGRLIEDEKIFYNREQEFLDLMKKYSIFCEYDEKEEAYTIYGYK